MGDALHLSGDAGGACLPVHGAGLHRRLRGDRAAHGPILADRAGALASAGLLGAARRHRCAFITFKNNNFVAISSTSKHISIIFASTFN